MLHGFSGGSRRARFFAGGSGGGDSKDKLLIGALVVVIAIAIGAAVMSFIPKSRGVKVNEFHFKCRKPDCNNEWVWTRAEYRTANEDMWGEQGATGEGDDYVLCPKCQWGKGSQGRWSGVHMRKCPYPECGKYYIPPRMLKQDPRLCPHCQKDTREGRKLLRKK